MLRKTGVGFLLSLVFVLFAYSSAVAEWYVGGAVGVSMPHDVTDFKGSGGTYTGTLTDFTPDNSFAGGVKLGYFFEQVPNLGVEFNWSISDPDVDKEKITATLTNPVGIFAGQASGDFLGTADVDSLNSFGFLAMLRITDEDAKSEYNGIQPYLGLGFSVNVLDVNKISVYSTAGAFIAETSGESNTSIGPLISAGLNYIINDRVKLYSEYKYKHSNFEYDELDGIVKYEFDGEESSLLFGASYSF